MRRFAVVISLIFFGAGLCLAQTKKPLLLQQPTVSRTQVAFAYAGDLWIVGRNGGEARRLTTSAGIESDPHFSPDGRWIAFSGQYDGNTDVFVVPAEGGAPRRLTYHPGADTVVGWTPDGKQVVFRSGRNSFSIFNRLFTVPVTGDFPSEVPLPRAEEGSFSPDGKHLAYVPNLQWQKAWKKYRGGQTTPIWIARLSDAETEKIPRDNSNDSDPMWVGDKIYFLSDRNGPVTLFAYDMKSKKVSQVVENRGLDIKSASAGPGVIAYEQFGTLYLLDLDSSKSSKLEISVSGDFPWARPHFENVAEKIANASLSPSGVRAVFEAHGDILTVPAEKGDIRDLTNTDAVAERDPAWSPDGKWIAYFSDESGEYALHIRDQSGMGNMKKINLGQPPSFFYTPVWSPDSTKIAFTDKRLNLWYVDVERRVPVKVATDTYEAPQRTLDPSWSPDSRWIAYTPQLKSHMHAVFVYDLDTGKSQQLSDGMSDARNAVFDKSGKYLYFTASTDIGLAAGWLDMSSINRPVTRSAYVVVLRKDLPSPLAPESDEEKAAEAGKNGEAKNGPAPEKGKEAEKGKKEEVKVTIDIDGISQRILALPIPARNYVGMQAGKSGELFLLEGPPVAIPASGFGNLTATLYKFDLKKRKTDKLTAGLTNFALSTNGEKMLFEQGKKWFIAGTAQPPKPGEGMLRMDTMQVHVDPRAEWRQMYREVWRIERDFLYDPHVHGLNLPAAEKEYAVYLDGIEHRADLNYLFEEMLGNIVIGHMFVGGGDMPEVKKVPVGLLGADYSIENGRYRFATVYSGENWNPQLRAPLTQPSVNVIAGEYLLAVNGKEVLPPENIYSFFEETAGKQVVLKVGPDPEGNHAREVTVVPVPSEAALRNRDWIESNRRKVDQMSGGKLAYVYLPNTAGGGYTNFNRYYFAQVGKEGAVLDERFNTGGDLADYIIDYLRRPLMSRIMTREGEDWSSPSGAIFGPKAMIINEMSGSGGDAMPWYFRKAGIGPLIGERTWGGLVGIYDYPELMDGGFVTAPRVAIYGLNGQWEVENHGVASDIEVEMDPKLMRQGHDPQLEKAVEVLMKELKEHPLPEYKRPPFPNYHKH